MNLQDNRLIGRLCSIRRLIQKGKISPGFGATLEILSVVITAYEDMQIGDFDRLLNELEKTGVHKDGL